jgi:catechol 2,3-dioxygenase-like lactoylglutathione lyase family enzyme
MFRHVGIVVKDIANQLKFYRDLLNLEVYYNEIEEGQFLESITGIKNIKGQIVKLGIDGKTIVELLAFNKQKFAVSNKEMAANGYTHFALTVKNLNNLYLELKKYEIFFVSLPKISNNGKYKVCFCRDFENNLIELVEEI